jgi:hypothetical protein
MEYKSRFDPSRETVGKTYRDLTIQEINSPNRIEVGDMTNELMSSLVYDLNDTILSDPHEGRPFYIQVHEKKDLQMPRAIHRTIRAFLWRPYPEDDTIVFWCNPKTNEIRFCWCLVHWSEMENMIKSVGLFDEELVTQIRAWKRVDLYHFGFMKDENGNWKANPNFKDKKMEFRVPKSLGKVISPEFNPVT